MRFIYITFLIFCGLSYTAFAQVGIPNNSIKWMSSRNIDLNSFGQIDEDFTIRTNPSKISVSNSTRTKDFMIISTSGSTLTLLEEGIITYQVSLGDKEGVIILECIAKKYTVTIDFSKYKDGIKRKFIIDNYIEE